MKTLLFIALIATSTIQVGWSQAHIVKDIQTEIDVELAGGPNFLMKSGNLVYFLKLDDKGAEVWRTDGTKAGTFRVSDVNPGFAAGSAQPSNLTGVNGQLIFSATPDLWKTDGTIAGTRKIGSPSLDGQIGSVQRVLKVGSNAVILSTVITNGTPGQHLFLYSSQDETITHLKELGTALSILNVGEANNRCFLTFANSITGTNQTWTSDGTASGTLHLTSLGNLNYSQIVGVGSNAIGRSGTNRLVVVNAETNTSIIDTTLPGEQIQGLYILGDLAIVGTNLETKIVNAAGIISTLIPNARPVDVGYGADGIYILGVKPSSTEVYLHYVTLNGMWDGNSYPLGTTDSPFSFRRQVAAVGDKVITALWDADSGMEPAVISNGNVSLLKDIRMGVLSSSCESYVELNGKVLFLATQDSNMPHGIWVTDGTGSGTQRLTDPFTRTANSVDTRDFYSFNNQAWFVARSGTVYGLWHSTSDGSDAVKDQDVNPSGFAIGSMNNEFYAYVNGTGFTKSDGNGNVTMFKSLASASTQVNPKDVVILGDKIIIPITTSVGYEPWVIDGTDAGTRLLKDINPGAGNSFANTTASGRVAKLNETTALFAASDGVNGTELWKTDGTEAGTLLVKDLSPSPAGSSLTNFVSFAGKVYFVGTDAVGGGAKVWVSDGTSDGTFILPGQESISSVNGNLREAGGILLFTANAQGWGIYKTDGTSVQIVKKLETSGNSIFVPGNSIALGNKMYFNFDDGADDRGLWVSDGTSDGTRLLVAGARPRPLMVADGQLYIDMNAQLYHIGGEKPSIEKLTDLEPVVAAKAGNRIYFKSYSNEFGLEMYSVPTKKFAQSIDFTIEDRVQSKGDFPLSATSDSGLPIIFTSVSPAIAITGANVDVKTAGRVTIKAVQEGDSNFESSEQSVTFCIAPDKPEITGNGTHLTTGVTGTHLWYVDGDPIEEATGPSYTVTSPGLYSVTVSVDGCVSEMSEEIIGTVTGLGDRESKAAIFPNPVSNTLFVTKPGKLRIIDLGGREILSEEKSDRIEVGSLAPGLYIAIHDNVQYFKFIKQ